MKNFKHLKFLAVATFGILFSSVATGQVISQYVGSNNNGGSEQLRAIEIFNSTGGPLTIGSGELSIREIVGNNNVTTWTYTGSDIEWSQNGVIVIAMPTNTTNYSNGLATNSELGEYALEAGADAVIYTNSLTFQDQHAIEVSTNNRDGNGLLKRDMLGDISSHNTSFLTDMVNYERDLAFLFTGFPNGVWSSSTTASTDVYGLLSNASTTKGIDPAYTVDDYEGFGLPPGNIYKNDNGWLDPTRSATNNYSLTAIAPSENCNVLIDNSNESALSTTHKSNSIMLRNNSNTTNRFINLGHNVNGTSYGQAKRLIARITDNSIATFNYNKHFVDEGWHLIGSPFPSGVNNITSGRLADARYWYWNGANWIEPATHATPGSVPKGRAIMVYVGNTSYSYASYDSGSGGDIVISSDGQESTFESFTWDRTGNADDTIHYKADGHTSVSQGSGWNVISNPFPCGLDWEKVWTSGTLQSIDGYVYIYDPTLQEWSYYDAVDNISAGVDRGIIPPYGAFMVKVTTDDPGAYLTLDVNQHSTFTIPANIFNKNFVYNTDVLQLSIKNLTSSASGMMIISHNPDYGPGYDLGVDIWSKETEGDLIPSIYTTDGNSGEIIKNSTNLNNAQSIPLGMNDLAYGNSYEISINQFNLNESNSYCVALEDTYLNTVCDLNQQSYQFNAANEIFDNRFVLHLSPNSSMGSLEFNIDESYLYLDNNTLFFNSGGNSYDKVTVRMIDGRVLYTKQIMEDLPLYELCELKTHGLYLVEISNNGLVQTKKILF